VETKKISIYTLVFMLKYLQDGQRAKLLTQRVIDYCAGVALADWRYHTGSVDIWIMGGYTLVYARLAGVD